MLVMVTLVQVSLVSVRQAVQLAWLCRILAAALAPFIPIQRTVRLLLCGVSGVTLAILLVEAGQVGPEAALLQAGVVGQLQQLGGQLEHRPLSHHFRVYRLTLLHGKQQGTEHFTPSCVLYSSASSQSPAIFATFLSGGFKDTEPVCFKVRYEWISLT